MSRRFRSHAHAEDFASRPSEPVEGFGLWANPAPSVNSASSEEAAESLSLEHRKCLNERILDTLAAVPSGACLSRYEIHERTGIDINVLCPRIKEDLMPDLVAVVERGRPSHKKPGLLVNGYRLTDAGFRRVRGAA